MKKICIFMLIMLSLVDLYAKRTAPKDVPPLEFQGKRYTVIHYGSEAGLKQNGGIIKIWDIEKNKLIEIKIIYRTFKNPLLEGDVQENFITELKISDDKNFLIIKTEKGKTYYLDLKDRSVRKEPVR